MAIVTTSQNLTSVSYVAGEIIEIRNGATLTISATPTVRPGTIQCITAGKLRIENSSSTVPLILELNEMNNDFRFEANGIFEIRGAPMSLGTGNGLSQTFDFSSLFGGAIKNITYVEIEESPGSGVYMPWPIVHEDPKFNLDVGLNTVTGGAAKTAFTAGNTIAGRFLFWHETNRTLSSGDGTNGSVIPNGCAIRIPNIYISNRHLTNTTRILGIATTGIPTGGTFTLEFRNEAGTILGTTSPINFNASATDVDTAIEAVTGAGTVTATGGSLPTAITVTWSGSLLTANGGLGDFPSVRVVTNSLTGGTNPQVELRENSAVNMSLLDLNPLGTLDAEWVSFSNKIRVATDVFKLVRLISVGSGADLFLFSASNGSLEVDGFSHVQSPFVSAGISGFSIIFGTTRIKRIVSFNKAPVISCSLQALPALTGNLDRVVTGFFGKRNAVGNRSYQVINCPTGQKFTNNYWIGASSNFVNLNNPYFINYGYSDGTLNVQDTTQITPIINATNVSDGVYANYTDAGPMMNRSSFFNGDFSCKNNSFFGGTMDARNQASNFAFMASSGVNFYNWSISNIRSGPLVDMPASFLANKLDLKKLFVTFATAETAANIDACKNGTYDLVSSTISGINEAFNGVEDFVGGNYATPGLTPTTGHVTFGPFGNGNSLTISGSSFTDGLGSINLQNSGDTAEITMPFSMHGITSFQNVIPFIFADIPGSAANVAVVGAPGAPTGGTFTISVFDSLNVLLGTTPALAFNASTATVDSAIEAIPGVGVGVTVIGSLSAGYSITFPTNQLRIVTVNGASLTGGSQPGVAFAVGRARLLTGTETLGAINTHEFAVRVPGNPWPSYSALTGANLSTAISSLSGYSAGGSGLEMKLRITSGQTNPFTRYNQISFPTNINPSLWAVNDATITLQGPEPTDVTSVVRLSDNTVLYTFTGAGIKSFTVGNNFDSEVYFSRADFNGNVLMITKPTTKIINFGDNGTIALFYGTQVQLAQVSDVSSIKTAVDTYLDVAISSRLATAGYTTPPTVTAIRSEIDSNSTKLDVAVSTRLASASYTAPANSDIAAIKAKTDNLPSDPADESSIQAAIAAIPSAPSATTVASAVRTELATELGRVDVAISTRLATAGYTAPANADIAAILVDTGTTLPAQIAGVETKVDTVDTVVDAIKVKTDNLPTDPADESSIQAAIAAIPAAPSASTVASAVRTELTTELGRVDVAVSTRLATSGYTAPANADIAAILVDTGTTIPAQISGLNNISAADVNAQVDIALADYDGPTKAELDSAQTSIEADIAANLTAIGVVNQGVKKASLLIPHSEDI